MSFTTDLHQVANTLRQAFPRAEPIMPLRRLGVGFSSIAFESASGFVFRIGLSSDVHIANPDSMRLLAQIAPHVTLNVPQIQFHLNQSVAFPHGVIGYPKLVGEPLHLSHFTSEGQAHRFAEQIGSFLADLHQLTIDGLTPVIDLQHRRQRWLQWRADALHTLPDMMSAQEFRTVTSWWDALLPDPTMDVFPPALVHGDPWYGNFLVDNHQIVGVLDFDQAGVHDPAVDFAAQLYCGAAFLETVLKAYTSCGGQLDDHVLHRTAQHLTLREFGGLSFALAHDMKEEIQEAPEKLRRSPLFSRGKFGDWPSPWL